MTGLVVNDPTTPGKAAESPAIAMNTSASLSVTIFSTRCGVLCADATWRSNGTPNLFRLSIAFWATGRSLLLPMMMETPDIVPSNTV